MQKRGPVWDLLYDRGKYQARVKYGRSIAALLEARGYVLDENTCTWDKALETGKAVIGEYMFLRQYQAGEEYSTHRFLDNVGG